MKYTANQVRSMTWHEWNKIMAKELNDAGFRARGYNATTGRWEDNYSEYEAGDDPRLFILGSVNKEKEISYLKSIGLLNNGRCPMCGNTIAGTPARFTSGYDENMHFQICQSCCNRGRKTSVNPANNSGCIVALFLMPFNIIKALLDML